ncbi:MAG: hypothetical protein WCJ17_02360 [bacterium]
MRVYARFLGVLCCVSLLISTSASGAVAGYDLSGGNSVFNRAASFNRGASNTPVLVQPVERPQTSSIFNALAKRPAQAKTEDFSGAVSEGRDPLALFCNQQVDEQILQDADLVRDVTLALGKNDDFLNTLLAVRSTLTSQWEEWFSTEKKEEQYAALLAAYEKELKKRGTIKSDSVHTFAKHTVLADYGNREFPVQMLQAMRTNAYYSLLFFVLGYTEWDTDIAREVNGIKLTDPATVQRMLADMIVAYRREYDAVFATACISTGLTFSRESKEKEEFFKSSMKNEFLGTTAPKQDNLSEQWNAIMSAARAYAHKEAAAFINAKLLKVTQLLTLFSARLEVVRVSDAMFEYPTPARASQGKLANASVQSILLGLAYRISQQLLMNNEYIINSQQMQSFFVQEYQGQQRLGHISGEVLTGERFLKTSDEVEKKQRKSFEARCAVLFGDIDFLLQGAFDGALQEALQGFDVARGAELYKKLMGVTCQRNGALWGIVEGERKSRMLLSSAVALKKLQHDIWAYLKTINLDAGSSGEMNQVYQDQIDLLIWTNAERSAFTTQSAVFFSTSSRAKRGRVNCSPLVYQALYRLFWLCVGVRLLGDVVRGDQSERVAHEEVDQVALQQVLERQQTELKKQTPHEDGINDDSLSGALMQAQKKLVSFGDTMGGRVEQLKGNALRYASGKSGMRSLNTDILNSFNDSSQLLDGMQTSIKAVFDKSDQASDRFVGSIKASLILVDRCVELCSKQMAKLRSMFASIASWTNNQLMSAAMRAVIGGKLKKMLTEVNRDNEVPLARIKQALVDLQLVLQGKKRSTDLQI